LAIEDNISLHSIAHLESLADQYAETKPAEAISIMEEICTKAEEESDYQAAISWYRRIVELGMSKNRLFDAARASFNSGLIYGFLGEVNEAAESYALAAKLFAEEGQERHMLDSLLESCENLANASEWERVIPVAEEARRISNIQEEYHYAGRACLLLSQAYFASIPPLGIALDNGEFLIALEYVTEAENHFKNVGDVLTTIRALSEKSTILGFLDREPEDLDALLEAEELLRDVPDIEENWPTFIDIYLSLGNVYERKDDYESGIEAYKRAMDFYEKAGKLETDSKPHLYLAMCQSAAGELEEALQNYEKAKKIAIDREYRWFYYRAEFGIADVLGDLGRHEEVVKICESAINQWKIDEEFIGADLVIFTNVLMISLNVLGRFEDSLNQLQRIAEIDDYFLTLEEALIFELRAGEALFGLTRINEAIEKLDLVIEGAPEVRTNYLHHLIAEAFELRGRAFLDLDSEKAQKDFRSAIDEFTACSELSNASRIRESYNILS
jgi:tetratricopeptide (TPR) repeat protein